VELQANGASGWQRDHRSCGWEASIGMDSALPLPRNLVGMWVAQEFKGNQEAVT
jgi:hypothetical protein